MTEDYTDLTVMKISYLKSDTVTGFDTTMHNQRAWRCKQVKSDVDFPTYYYKDCRSITNTSTCLMRGTSTVFTFYTK